MAIEISRGFVRIKEGQVHFRACGEPAKPPLVMFHKAPGSSYSLLPLMAELGRFRRVIAIDTLGNGDSAAPAKAQPDIAYLADAHIRAMDAMGLEKVDIYGAHTGASICAELSILHASRVRRIVMDGVSLFDRASQERLLKGGQAPEIRPNHEGTQLLAVWSMVKDYYCFWPWWDRVKERRRDMSLPPADKLHEEVVEVLKALPTYHLSYRAALAYPKKERLPLVRHRTLVCCTPTDTLRQYLDAVVAVMPDARGLVTAGDQNPDELAATASAMVEFLES